MTMWDGRRGATRRASAVISGYVGPNGSGKSLLMVLDAVYGALAVGRPVVSSVRLLDGTAEPCDDDGCTWGRHPDHGRAHPLWVPLTCWDDLLEAEHCDVLLDEVTGIASSRDSSSLPSQVADRLMQLRRRDVRLRWTAPAWARADLLLREVTQAVTLCSASWPTRAEGQLWPTARWISARTVDARDLEELTQAQRLGVGRIRLDTLCRTLVRLRACAATRYYDTLDVVSALSTTGERGTCLRCGGRRQQPRCTCAGVGPEVHPAHARRAADDVPRTGGRMPA